MSALGDIVTRWNTNSPIPAIAGAASEGTEPPFVVFVYVSGSEERCAPNTVAWQNSLISFIVSETSSVLAESATEFARQLFNMKSFGEVADMIVTNRGLFYTDTPTLTGNRGWVAQLDFQVKH
jgi:hypothetical protein